MKCCDITIGMLNRKISIQRENRVKNDTGGYDLTWSTVLTPWARIKPKSGGEKVHANRLDATGLSQVVIRYNDSLVETDRVLYKGNLYQIRSIINIDEQNQWTEIIMERGVVT